MVAWVPDMFSNFYLVKNYKIENNSTVSEARVKIRKNWVLEVFGVSSTKLKKHQVLQNKISHQFLVTTNF
jgi:hypothetical protein